MIKPFLPGMERAPLTDSYSVADMDSVAWLASLPSGSVDLIVTDPAYESLEKHRAKGTTTRLKVSDGSSNAWFDIFPNTRFEALFHEAYRVLAKDSHLYVMCDQETMFVVKPIAEAAGFTFWKPIVWDKVTIGMGYHYRARYEFVLFFEKGKRRLANLGTPDVLAFPRVRGGYPTEKPVELSKVLIEQSSSLGDIVADPFMGSGSIGVAALETGRRFVGTDISAHARETATKRFIEHTSRQTEGPITTRMRTVGVVTSTGVLTDAAEPTDGEA